MWRLRTNQGGREQGPLEGRNIEVDKLRLLVTKTIAQGGFSFVYLTKCSQTGKMYALKHVRCNDDDGIAVMKKEIGVMLSLRTHPNVVTLHAHSKLKTGSWTEFFLAMDYCEKTLVNLLESRGQSFYEEKQLLLIFREVCNGVYAMHSRNVPIAHRDLKPENILLGGDGHWKLCDFGSTSTTHKRFVKAEEMGREEDVIRKHTTPAYRAPEMWDLYSRDLISEKVDIWALGCLLYRLAYFKLCFDGDSKLQILNGNYRIPESPQYSTGLLNLIERMLTADPEKRPDITQVWRDLNNLLPSNVRKAQPDELPKFSETQNTKPKSQQPSSTDQNLHKSSAGSQARSPALSPEKGRSSQSLSPPNSQRHAGQGSFWASQFAQQPHSEYEASHPSTSPLQPGIPLSPRSTVEAKLQCSPKHRNGLDVEEAMSTGKPNGDFFRNNPLPRSGDRGGSKVESTAERESTVAFPDFFGGGYPGDVQRSGMNERNPSSNASKLDEVMGLSLSPRSSVKKQTAFSADEEESGLRGQVKKLQQDKADLAARCETLGGMVRTQRKEILELKAALERANNSKEKGFGNPQRDTDFSPQKVSSSQLTTGREGQQLSEETSSRCVLPNPHSFEVPSFANKDPSGMKSNNVKTSAAVGWQPFEELGKERNSTNNGHLLVDDNGPDSDHSGGNQNKAAKQHNWAAFESLSGTTKMDNRNGVAHRTSSHAIPSPQWESISVKDGKISRDAKAKDGSRTSQPSGWAGF